GVVCPSPGTRYMTTMILVTVNGSAGGICVMAIVLFHGLGLVQVLLSERLGHFLGRRRVGVVLHRNLLPGLGPACWCSCRLGEARPARAAGWGWPAGDQSSRSWRMASRTSSGVGTRPLTVMRDISRYNSRLSLSSLCALSWYSANPLVSAYRLI